MKLNRLAAPLGARYRLTLAALATFVTTVSYSQDTGSQRKALALIREFGHQYCADVSMTSSRTEVAEEINVRLASLTKGLSGNGVNGMGKLSHTATVGLLQTDLLAALKNRDDCRLRVFETLTQKLMPTVGEASGGWPSYIKLSPEGAAKMDDVVALMKKKMRGQPDVTLTGVIQHDTTGKGAATVARWRAEFIRQYFFEAGFNPERIKIQTRRGKPGYRERGMVEVDVEGSALNGNDTVTLATDLFFARW